MENQTQTKTTHPRLRWVRMYCDRYVPFKTKELPTRWERFCLFFATPIVKRMGATDWRVFKVAANKLWVADAIRSENSVWPTNKEQQ